MRDAGHSAMEFFVLALVSRGGLRSLYELQHGAGLQPGGIRPVLDRLEEDGLLERSKQERRRRRAMSVTTRGERLLEAFWRDCMREYPDVESIFRAATVAILMESPQSAFDYLAGVAGGFEDNVPSVEVSRDKKRAPIEWYTLMRSFWEVRRRKCVAGALREVAAELEEETRRWMFG